MSSNQCYHCFADPCDYQAFFRRSRRRNQKVLVSYRFHTTTTIIRKDIAITFVFILLTAKYAICFQSHVVSWYRHHENVISRMLPLRVVQTYPSSNAKHNYNIMLPTAMIARQKTAKVPILFASEAHRRSHVLSQSPRRNVLRIAESSSLATTSTTAATTSLDAFLQPKKIKADEEAVLDVVFPLYGDLIRMLQSLKTFCTLVSNIDIPKTTYYRDKKRYLLGRRDRCTTWWSDHPIFQRLCAWAFDVCATCTGTQCTVHGHDVSIGASRIDRTQVYAGILLVHLQLAPYLGVAACHPPSREMIDEMFEKADYNHLGTVGLEEFTDILILSFTHISSRILMYYGILLVGLPLAAKHACALLAPIQHMFVITNPFAIFNYSFVKGLISMMSTLLERIVCVGIFVGIVPCIFHYIDYYAANNLLKPKHLKQFQQQLKRKKHRRRRWNDNHNNQHYYDDVIHSFDDIS